MTSPAHPGATRRVGIVLLSGIGDVVHGLPIALDLKRRDPGCEVVWIAEPAPAEVVRHHPAVDEVIAFDKRAGLRGLRSLRTAMRTRRCDLTLNFMRYIKGSLASLLTGAKTRIGLPPSKTRDGAAWFNTTSLRETPWMHTQDLFLRFREPLGIPADDPVEWRVTFTPAEHRERDAWFAPLRERNAGPIVGLVLATANPEKDWPADRYPNLVRALRERFGARVVLVGGPSERERDAARRIGAARLPVHDGLGDSVRRMMWMVDGVDLLISPDTGPLHLAHALETPVVGLFGHTNPARVGPWRRYRDLVVDHYTDPGETSDPSRYDPRHGRMEQITVDEIMTRVERALSSRAGIADA